MAHSLDLETLGVEKQKNQEGFHASGEEIFKLIFC